jgi:hypothetical protein
MQRIKGRLRRRSPLLIDGRYLHRAFSDMLVHAVMLKEGHLR